MYTIHSADLSSVVEEEAASAICVLGISWTETLLPHQSCLLVPQTLRGGGGGYAPFTLTCYMHRCNISTMESDSLHREEFLSEHLLPVGDGACIVYNSVICTNN